RGEAEQGGSVAGRLPQNFGAQVGTTFRQLPRTIQATFSAVALAPGWGSVEVQPVMLTSPTSRRPTSSTRWACARTRTRIACSWSGFPLSDIYEEYAVARPELTTLPAPARPALGAAATNRAEGRRLVGWWATATGRWATCRCSCGPARLRRRTLCNVASLWSR